MKKLRVSAEARAELAAIWLYIFGKNERAADRMVEEIAAQYEQLSEFPGMGIRREELGPGYRSLPTGMYVIYYRVLEDEVEISHILHGSKDVTGLFPETRN